MTEQTPAGTQFSASWMGAIGGFLAVVVTLVVAAQTIIPYYMVIPEANSGTIGQQQTMFQTVFVMIASFFFGASVGSRLKDNVASRQADAAASQASTIAALQANGHGEVTATVTTPSATVPLHAGETATVKADNPPAKPASGPESG
jgi:hypothetical protein